MPRFSIVVDRGSLEPVYAQIARQLRARLRDVLARLRQAGLGPKELERIASKEIAALSRDGQGR